MGGPHTPSFRYQRGFRVTVACRCGWVHENCRSAGEARRAWDAHTDRSVRSGRYVVGVDAHRRDPGS